MGVDLSKRREVERCPACGRILKGPPRLVPDEIMEYVKEHEPVHGSMTDLANNISRSLTATEKAVNELIAEGRLDEYRKSRYHRIWRSLE